jgi:hypothetical protein
MIPTTAAATVAPAARRKFEVLGDILITTLG